MIEQRKDYAVILPDGTSVMMADREGADTIARLVKGKVEVSIWTFEDTDILANYGDPDPDDEEVEDTSLPHFRVTLVQDSTWSVVDDVHAEDEDAAIDIVKARVMAGKLTWENDNLRTDGWDDYGVSELDANGDEINAD